MALPLVLLALLTGTPPSDAVSTTRPEASAPATAPTGSPEDYIPQGAPSDDFAFVAWCHGVLSGHMELAEQVKDILPIDDVQQRIGSAYLRGYEEALAKAPEGKSPEGQKRAEEAQSTGFHNWDQARAADKQLAADTYLGWQLPGRCEHAAVRVSKNPDLFKMAPEAGEIATSFGKGAPPPTVEVAAAPAAPEPAAAEPAPVEQAAAEPVSPAPEPVTEPTPAPAPAPAVVAEAKPAPEEAKPEKKSRIPGFLRQKAGPARP
jgi:hypothetical protein